MLHILFFTSIDQNTFSSVSFLCLYSVRGFLYLIVLTIHRGIIPVSSSKQWISWSWGKSLIFYSSEIFDYIRLVAVGGVSSYSTFYIPCHPCKTVSTTTGMDTYYLAVSNYCPRWPTSTQNYLLKSLIDGKCCFYWKISHNWLYFKSENDTRCWTNGCVYSKGKCQTDFIG